MCVRVRVCELPAEVSSSLEEYKVTSVTEVQIVIYPWVWYSNNILPMKNDRPKFKSMWDSYDKIYQDRLVFL